MSEKKRCAIVFGLTSNLTFALANVLLGMKKHCSFFWDDIIVFHDNISISNQECLNSILKCKFIKYDYNFNEKIKMTESLRTYSILSLARFECFNLLNEYRKIIWNDVDILIQDDFSSLLDYGNESGIALTCDPTFMVEQNFYGVIHGYNLLKPLYNSGIMVVSDKLDDYTTLSKYCYDKFIENVDVIRYTDQAVLNMMIQDHSIKVEQIELNIFCCHPTKEESKDAIIVHSYGIDKFWNSNNLKKRFKEWVDNDKEWLKVCENKKYNSIDNPVVSVIMSIYDRMDFVEEAIDSILNQTFKNFELIIVIEYSNNQKFIANKINKINDRRIIVILNDKKIGFSESLNVGISVSKGKYLARMDDDDISLPERLEKQVRFMDEHVDVTAVGTFIKMFMNSEQLCEIPIDCEELSIRSLTETPIYHPTVVMRKEHFDKYNLKYDSNFFTEDYALWSEMINKGLKISNIPEVLLLYRASGQNATATKGEQVIQSHIKVMKNNFKKNLCLDFTDDQLLLLRNPNLVHNCFNSKEFVELRNKAVGDIIISNSILKRYDQEKLKKYFDSNLEVNFKNKIKYKFNKYPLLFNIAKNCYNFYKIITNHQNSNNKIKNIGERKMSILKKLKMKLLPPSSKSFHNRMDDIDMKFDIILDRMSNTERTFNYIIEKIDYINGRCNTIEDKIDVLKIETKKMDEKILNRINNINEKNYAKILQVIKQNQNMYLEKIQDINMFVNNSNEDNLSELIDDINNKLERLVIQQENKFGTVFNKLTESERWLVREIRASRFDILFKLDKIMLENNIDTKEKNYIYNRWFYMNNRYGSFISGLHFLKNIIPTFKIKKIVDFGCGTGTWLAAAKTIADVEVLGIDGDYVNKNDLMIDESEFLTADLIKEVVLDKKFDLAISVEVAEHLPSSSSDALVRSLCNASDIVLFSAAHVGQGGDGHINCQPFEFWQEKFLSNNFYYINIKEQFKNDWEIEGWYRENISLFISYDRLNDFEVSSNFYKGTI